MSVAETHERKSHVWKRDELDWYVEPVRVTEQLLAVEKFSGPIWDPACGQGNIVDVFCDHGYEAWGTDIANRTEGTDKVFGWRDFLSDAPLNARDIVCNPPYFHGKGAEAFIRRALALATGKVAMFVDVRFLGGAGRAKGLWAEHPPTRVWYVTPRPSCPPGAFLEAGGKAGNGTSDYMWLVWDLTAPFTSTTLGWLK